MVWKLELWCIKVFLLFQYIQKLQDDKPNYVQSRKQYYIYINHIRYNSSQDRTCKSQMAILNFYMWVQIFITH